MINDEGVLRKSKNLEIVLGDGNILRQDIIGKGTIVLHNRETDKGLDLYKRITIYEENMNKVYENLKS